MESLANQLAENSQENHEVIDATKAAQQAATNQPAGQVQPATQAQPAGQAQPTQQAQPTGQAQPVQQQQPAQQTQPVQQPVQQPAAQQQPEQQPEPQPIDASDMSMYNYKTGQHLMQGASDKEIARVQAANRAAERLWQLYQVNDNPSDSDIEAALGSDAFAFNSIYGDKKDNWATAFGKGYLGGRITGSQRTAVDEYRRKRQEYETQQQEQKHNAARDAHEAKYKFNLGDKEIHVDKEKSDAIKSIAEAFARYDEQDRQLMSSVAGVQGTEEQLRRVGVEGISNTPSPDRTDIKAKKQKAIGALREQLANMGIDLGPAPEGGEFESIEDLIASAPDYETENAIEQALTLAGNRTEYDPEAEDKRSFEERYREREEQKAEIEKRTKQREIERANNRLSIAGLAATIGDMVRASEGGRVDPRDWQQMYDNLTAQEKANVDNYRLRMQKLEDDANRQRMQDKQIAAEAARQREQYEFQAGENEKNRELTRSENEKKRAARLVQTDKNNKAAQERTNTQVYGRGQRTPAQTNITFRGKTHFLNSSHNDNTLVTLYGMLKSKGLDFGIEDALLGPNKIPEIKARVLPALQNMKELPDGSYMITFPTKIDGEERTSSRKLSLKDVEELENYLLTVSGKQSGGSNYEYSSTTQKTDSAATNTPIQYDPNDVR